MLVDCKNNHLNTLRDYKEQNLSRKTDGIPAGEKAQDISK